MDGLAFSRCYQRVVRTLLGCQLCQLTVTPDRFQRHLRLKIYAEALPSRLHSHTNPSGREQLNTLFRKLAPPHSALSGPGGWHSRRAAGGLASGYRTVNRASHERSAGWCRRSFE
jgi:hypothetical protein